MFRVKKHSWLIAAFLLLSFVATAQTPERKKTPEEPPHKVAQDSIEKDLSARDTTQNKFIQRVEKSAKKSKLVDFLTSALLSGPVSSGDSTAAENFSTYDGKIARNVTVVGLDPYENSDLYPDKSYESGLTRLANALHIQTHKFILRRELLFHKGDKISNELLLYNLAHFRSLRHIYDAHLIVSPVEGSDSVDIKFIVKDVWSIGVDVRSLTPTKSNMELYDRNMLGFGFELRAGALYRNFEGNSYLGYSLSQRTNNIRGTFISNNLEWISTHEKEVRRFAFERAILPQIKYVGGLSYLLTDQEYFFLLADTTMKVRTETEDIWAGRVFNLSKTRGPVGPRLAILARYGHQSLLSNLPDRSLLSIYYPYEDRDLFIGSLSLFRQNYYTDRLIYGFGSHENIPYGYNATLQVGYEDHVYTARMYTSGSLSYGQQFSWGYGYIKAGASSFFNEGKGEDGMLEFDVSYFSPLYPIGRQALRQFLYITYTKGLNREIGEGNHLRYADDIRFGLDRNSIGFFGRNRLTLSSETDLFSTVRLLGFRFVFFSFLDATWIGNSSRIFSNDFLPGLGAGIRIRNDKLVFRTLQIKFGWYPQFPQNGFSDYFEMSGVDRFMTNDFVPKMPAVVPFE